MKIDHLLYFYETSQRKSLNESAKYLHLSQPSLSSSIRSLEEELGIQIFYRTNNGILLTEAGKEALDHVKIILEQYNILMSIKNNKNIQCSPVNIFTQRSLSKVFLSSELIEYIRLSRLIVHSGEAPSESFDAGNKDNAPLYLKFYPREMLPLVQKEAEKQGRRILSLATGSVCLFINSSLELAQKRTIRLADLHNLTFATSSKAEASIYDHNRIFRQAAFIKNCVVFPDRQTIFDAIAKSKNFYTISPKFDMMDNLFIKQGIIMAREFDDFSLPLVFCLMVPSSRELNSMEEEVVLLIKKQFRVMKKASVL